MAWKDLSIAQRSQLMNIMRHNGISSLSEMRRLYDLSSPSLSSLGESTFNMRPQAPVYAVGGPKGLDEYIQKKLTEMRERAHKASLERTAPAVPPGKVKMTNEEKWELEQIRKEAADYARQDALQVMQNFAEGLDYVVSPELYDVSDHKEQRMEPGDESAANHWRLAFLRGAKEWDDAAKRTMSEEIWKDPATCIYTATDNYGRPYRIAGNKSFYANPEKYGFKRITVAEVMPGDVVQTKDLSHSMNFNRYDEEGEARYNYSRGGTDERDIVKDGYYTFPLTDKYYNVYRFVGTPADSTRWKQEYAEGMRAFGGHKVDMGGERKWKTYAEEYEEKQRKRSAMEQQFPVHKVPDNAERHSVSNYGVEYYDVVNMHYRNLMENMRRRGFTYKEAQRLVPILTMQLIREGDWTTERAGNNFGGLRVNDRKLEFDSLDEFYNTYLDTLDRKWGKGRGQLYNWRYAKDYLDYAKRVNRDDLHLHTQEEYDAYNRQHPDNPVYLYAPEWNNNNSTYWHLMGQVRDRTNHYMRMILEENPYTEDMYNAPIEPVVKQNDGLNLSMEQFQSLLNANKETFSSGGHKIHIKKANRGKFTALKKRTGHSASWFKAHGTPAQKKMAIFALNARKWKHEHGGIKF